MPRRALDMALELVGASSPHKNSVLVTARGQCCMADFADVALGFAACECRLTNADEVVHAGNERINIVWDKN
jgi:hypothetical protein